MCKPSTGIRTLLAGALVLVLTASPFKRAGAQDVSGTWHATWARAVRTNRDGSMEIQKWDAATLVLHQEGDAVTGMWTTRVAGVVHWKVEGTLLDGRLELTALENDSDDPALAMVSRMRWRGAVEGDRLEGEMTLEFRGSDRPRPWRPWRAKRAEGG